MDKTKFLRTSLVIGTFAILPAILTSTETNAGNLTTLNRIPNIGPGGEEHTNRPIGEKTDMGRGGMQKFPMGRAGEENIFGPDGMHSTVQQEAAHELLSD